jgi:hypothetical protein
MGPGGPSIDECIDAGLYYFSRGELRLAEHWWNAALLLEPENRRARECLRYLDRLEGQEASALPPADLLAEPPTRPPASIPVLAGAGKDDDPWGAPDAEEELGDPWTSGPEATSVVTVAEGGWDEDAVADRTPFPVLDREPLFGSPLHLAEDKGIMRERIANSPVLGSRRNSDVGRKRELFELSPDVLLRQAEQRLALDDFDGALELLEGVPAESPAGEAAYRLARDATERLEQQYGSQLGGFDLFPRVTLPADEIIWLNLNHRAGFILSQIDGHVTYEDLVSLSGMPRIDTLRILCTLLQEGVIRSERDEA